MAAEVEAEVSVCMHDVAIRYWDIPLAAQDLSDLQPLLIEEGERRAAELIPQGYHSGELNCLIAETDCEVRGWWEIAA